MELIRENTVSIPAEIPTAETTKKKEQQIDHSIYKIGELIVPQTFKKLQSKVVNLLKRKFRFKEEK